MILVRNLFRVKYGQAKPALEAFKNIREIANRLGLSGARRVLTDVTGPAYTIVLEGEYESLTAFEQEGKTIRGNAEWRAMFDKFIPYVESGSREIFTVVDLK
jgi:hypothetical protein